MDRGRLFPLPAGPSLAAALVLAAVACARGAGARLPSSDPAEAELALAREVRAERAVRRVRELCALGPRMGGTRSNERSAAYLQAAFESMGLEVRVVCDPARRCFEARTWRLEAQPLAGPSFELSSAWPYVFSPSARGRAGLALQASLGAALLAFEPPLEAGALEPALVLVDGATTIDGRYPLVLELSAALAGRVPHFGLSRAEGERLRALLAQGETVAIDYGIEAETREAPALSVVARLPARAPRGAPWSEDHFLMCAHGDSDAGGPGADDNASGAAAVLEVAQAWSTAIAAGLVTPPERELRFAVWGAEIHSSRAYLERRGPGDGELLGVINFDQAGFGSGADCVYVEPDDLPANRRLVRVLAGVLRDHAPRATGGPPEDFPSEWATVKSLGGTDSYVFSSSESFRVRGLPAITVYASAWGAPQEHPRTPGMPGESWSERSQVAVDHDVVYHSAGDTPENTTDREPWNTAWCARVALLGARRFLSGTEHGP